MKERLIESSWRSYKVFRTTGTIKQHSPVLYLEITFGCAGGLFVKVVPDRKKSILLEPNDWNLQQINGRCYLMIHEKKVYEVITLEKEDLVLLELSTGDKIFFTILPEWQRLMEPQPFNAAKDQSITLWSKSLIEQIKG
jgi:hypothetical protein